MFRTILVPLDGSPSAEHALPVAISVAHRTGGRIRLVHVFVPMPSPYTPDLPPEFEARQQKEASERAADYLEKLGRRLDDFADEPVGYDVLVGSVVDGVQDAASRHGADLIVMTTHGRGGFARAWLGSAADAVVRGVGVPVLLTRPGEAGVDLAREVRVTRVLVPLDGSPLAEEALAPAAELAAGDGRITLLAVAAAPHPYPVPVHNGVLLGPLATGEDARAYLERVAARLSAGGASVDVTVLAHATPALAILEAASDDGVDLIAIATHGRGGVARLVLGSTADKVIRGAPMPVLAWRPRP